MYTFSPEQLPDYQDFAYGENVFTPQECDAIIAQLQVNPIVSGTVGAGEGSVDQAIRKVELTRIDWQADREWLYQKLMSCVVQCNNSFYRFQLTGFLEQLEIIRYNVGSFYDWHQDFGTQQLSIRKLSVVLQLADSNDYEGGSLEFFTSTKPLVAPRSRGSVVVFPSYVVHRVLPITAGRRHSLVGWVSGPHFR